ncbi:MAG: ATP cone domain-containing protein, partial [Acetivibrio sp.]
MMFLEETLVRKKNGALVPWSEEKLMEAVNKSAARCRGNDPEELYYGKLTDQEEGKFMALVENHILPRSSNVIRSATLHTIVENSLREVAPDVAESYINYRNFRIEQGERWEKIKEQCNSAVNNGDPQNANADSTLASTL